MNEEQTIYKFKFWVNAIESEIYEYDLQDFDNYEDLIEVMEMDRVAWVFDNIDSGYTLINK